MCSNSEDQAEVLSPDAYPCKIHSSGRFGYQQFRQGQQQIIAATLQGQSRLYSDGDRWRQIALLSNTGALFSRIDACGFPFDPLMQDQVDQLTANGVAAAYLNSSQTLEQQREIEQQALSGKLEIALYFSGKSDDHSVSILFSSVE